MAQQAVAKAVQAQLAQLGQAGNHDWQQQAFRSQQNIKNRFRSGSPMPQKQRQEKIEKILHAVKGGPVNPGEIDNDMFYKKNPALQMLKPKEKTMFGTFKSDVKNFMTEHKGLIYGLVGLYLLDHFVLEGKLKAKLLDLAHKLIGKLEAKVDQVGTSAIEQK